VDACQSNTTIDTHLESDYLDHLSFSTDRPAKVGITQKYSSSAELLTDLYLPLRKSRSTIDGDNRLLAIGAQQPLSAADDDEEAADLPAPESDARPHINQGPAYQAYVADWATARPQVDVESPEPADLLFSSRVLDGVDDRHVHQYLEFACSSLVKGAARNKEYSMRLLAVADGNVQVVSFVWTTPFPNIYFLKFFF
jgi:hypothetical protein